MELENIQILKDGMDTNFFYQETSSKLSQVFCGAKWIFSCQGLIPMEISAKGEEAIKQYAEEMIIEDIDR